MTKIEFARHLSSSAVQASWSSSIVLSSLLASLTSFVGPALLLWLLLCMSDFVPIINYPCTTQIWNFVFSNLDVSNDFDRTKRWRKDPRAQKKASLGIILIAGTGRSRHLNVSLVFQDLGSFALSIQKLCLWNLVQISDKGFKSDNEAVTFSLKILAEILDPCEMEDKKVLVYQDIPLYDSDVASLDDGCWLNDVVFSFNKVLIADVLDLSW